MCRGYHEIYFGVANILLARHINGLLPIYYWQNIGNRKEDLRRTRVLVANILLAKYWQGYSRHVAHNTWGYGIPHVLTWVLSFLLCFRVSRDILTVGGILCFNGAMNKLTAKQEKFCQAIADGRRYYVYQLIDPRDGSVFYIGKGTGERIKQHTREAKAGIVGNAKKHQRIDAILAAGLSVREIIVADNLDEKQAYQIEREMIKAMKNDGITNILNGCVTNAEKSVEQAKALIKMTKPFELWAATISDYKRKAVIAASGSLEAFYKDRMEFLNMVVGMGKNGR